MSTFADRDDAVDRQARAKSTFAERDDAGDRQARAMSTFADRDDAGDRQARAMSTLADPPTLRGGRILLRPIEAGDAGAMWADLADEEANRLTGTHESFTRDQIDRWCASRADAADRWDLAVVDVTTGDWLGEVVISDWDPDNRSCSFRIALGPGARDRGVGTEATRLVVDAVFDLIDDPPVHRIELEVYAFNPRARAVYERIGFQTEGVRRDALRWDGEFVDAVVMSILRTDRAPTAVRPIT